MQIKPYRKFPTGEKPLATGLGNAFATDLITVHGNPVGYMYRDRPDNATDSGWRFLAGFESDDYMDDPSNIGLFDVNTIANYDSDIVPLLTSPTGSAFVRDDRSNAFIPASPPFAIEAAESATNERTFQRMKLIEGWSMLVEDGFRRRMEGENLVLWAPGRTVWVSVFGHEQSPASMLKELREMSPSEREATFIDPREDVLRYGYLNPQADGDQVAWGLMTFAVGDNAYVAVAFYFRDRKQVDWALDCWRSINFDGG